MSKYNNQETNYALKRIAAGEKIQYQANSKQMVTDLVKLIENTDVSKVEGVLPHLTAFISVTPADLILPLIVAIEQKKPGYLETQPELVDRFNHIDRVKFISSLMSGDKLKLISRAADGILSGEFF